MSYHRLPLAVVLMFAILLTVSTAKATAPLPPGSTKYYVGTVTAVHIDKGYFKIAVAGPKQLTFRVNAITQVVKIGGAVPPPGMIGWPATLADLQVGQAVSVTASNGYALLIKIYYPLAP
jgi:hypothetical protein